MVMIMAKSGGGWENENRFVCHRNSISNAVPQSCHPVIGQGHFRTESSPLEWVRCRLFVSK